MEPHRSHFATTSRGLDYRLYPMKLWRKAKKLGTWDPEAIDFAQDTADWQGLSDPERDLLLRLTAQFQAGEESVTYDLLPMLQVMAEQGRIEDEMFLTSYLWEEAKHVEGFGRFIREVTGAQGDLEHYFTEPYKQIFFEELPRALRRLQSDHSPEAVAKAAVTYQMIVEGVLAETGYHAYYTVLEANDLMPGMQQFIRNVQRDEARHVSYGVHLLARLAAEHGDAVWPVIEARMTSLIMVALHHIEATLGSYDEIPFGVTASDFTDFGMAQFQKRYARIEHARSQPLEAILYGDDAAEGDRAAATTSASLPGSA